LKKDFILSNKVDMSEYTKALELIEKSRYILIVTHVNPDPDSIGSALALSNLFYENKIKHKVYNISSDLPMNLDFISRAFSSSMFLSATTSFSMLSILPTNFSKHCFDVSLSYVIVLVNARSLSAKSSRLRLIPSNIGIIFANT